MMNKTNIGQPELQNFIVMRDGELDPELSHEPTMTDHVVHGLQAATEAARLHVRMFTYDALHHTNYRAIRHQLVRQKKEAEFISSIGLSRK